MKGDDLPANDHIVHYVKPSMILEDGSLNGSEFRLRHTDPDVAGLSVNWLEILGQGKIQQLVEVRRLCRLTRRTTGRFAELSCTQFARKKDAVRIVHDPLPAQGQWDDDPSHSEIKGLPPGESDHAMLIGDLIAQHVVEMDSAVSETEE